MNTWEDIEAEGREEAARERYERRFGPEPECYECISCGERMHEDSVVGACEECEGQAALCEWCAVCIIPSDSTYLCRHHAAITPDQIADINDRLIAEAEARIELPPMDHPYLLLAALAALPAQEIRQIGERLSFVYGCFACEIRHGLLVVRHASEAAAQIIASLLVRYVEGAGKADGEPVATSDAMERQSESC